MTTPHMTLVITTINIPTLLEEYAANFEKHGHLEHTSAIIVGDKKTPHDAAAKVASDLRGRGFDCLYLDLPAQEQYLERFPRLKPLIPYNSDNRRNIGYLMAVEKGADILVAVDDDNFVMADDWYAGHAHVGSSQRLETVSSANGWFNPCQLMEYEPHCTIYARGYPYNKRWQPNKETSETTIGRVVLNGGLWLNDPDVDSLTRLSVPARGVSVRKPRVMLAPGTWAPINTQNTAFHRDVVPAFYFVPVGEPISGLPVERYGDIWAGFFAKKIIDHLNDRVTFGAPACDHRRNAHKLLHDLELEFWSVVLTDPLAEVLRSWELSGSTYSDCYAELADHLERTNWPHKKMAGEMKAFFGRMAAAMRVWVETCRQIGY
ncbi:MAG TPA: hypothetical protein VN688_16975 [Gemmataceae bacterium]|nr:hypothetical protein [Gemmataceae bacterium]